MLKLRQPMRVDIDYADAEVIIDYGDDSDAVYVKVEPFDDYVPPYAYNPEERLEEMRQDWERLSIEKALDLANQERVGA